MKLFRIMFILLFLVMSMGLVSAQDCLNDTMQADILAGDEVGSFEELENDIINANDTLEITKDYRNDNYPGGIRIANDNLVINGNNHTLDGKNQGIFLIGPSSNITINNLIFINAHFEDGAGAVSSMGMLTLNNVVFVNNSGGNGGAVFSMGMLTLNNAVFVNNSGGYGGAVFSMGMLTLNNVVFVNNSAGASGGAVFNGGSMDLNDVVFVNNSGGYGGAVFNRGSMELCGAVFVDNVAGLGGGAISGLNSELSISNAFFSSKILERYGQVFCMRSNIRIENSTFLNMTSSYSPALFIQSSNVSISNSRFINLSAEVSAGAIAIKEGGNYYIKGCEFINTSSSKNAGALNIDITGLGNSIGNVTIVDTLFKDTYSDFGGALIQLGGNLCVSNSDFMDAGATYNGGSVYISFANAEIDNCTFDSNGVKALENITTCGSAIYCDISSLTLSNSRVINKSKGSGSAVYACDSSYTIANSIFMDNTNAVYTDFDKASNLVDNVYGNGSVSTNNTFVLETIRVDEGIELKLINNSINVTSLPSRFDLRDWNWTSPVGNQGVMGACWAFATNEALESALRKACGITTEFSINNMQKTMIRYSNYGINHESAGISLTIEAGDIGAASSYLVSWLGAFPQDYDTFDEVGKISRVITTDENIHIQDVIFTWNDEPGSAQIKSALLKYASFVLAFYPADEDPNPYFNPETNAQYVYDKIDFTHMVVFVGWDDNYPKENFLVTPPGDGAWIIQNSWGTDWGDNGYMYLSYYDESLLKVYGGSDIINPGGDECYGMVIIFENTIPYNKNYQYGTGWYGEIELCGNVSYASTFEALDDDLIAAVGTYFNDSNVDYRVDVYVNDELKLTQEGLSPYAGFHTIKLNEYIPIKAGDVFSAVITSNAMPVIYLNGTRVHYTHGLSYRLENGSWVDLYDEGKLAYLKVYTVADDRQNTTLIAPDRVIGVSDAIHGYDYQFILKDENGTALANREVLVSFNGESQTVVTDENGWGTVTVNANAEGIYTVEITFRGSNDYYDVSQNATVKLVRQKTAFVAPDRVVYVRDMSNGYEYSAILKDNYGKPLANKKMLFIFNGKKQVAYTDENGWATVTLTADTAGVQTVTIKFAGDRCYQETSITKTIKIVREASKLTVSEETYKKTDSKQVTATLKSKSGNPIYGAKVTFTVDGRTYSATTDDDGVATFSIDLFKLGTFHASTRFEDSRFYAATTTTSKVIIY